jgi:pyruvate-formate lyase-activating enzyme
MELEKEMYFPYVGIERGYFLDVQHFFGDKKLVGFKVLTSVCNFKCYYCHRKSFLYDTNNILTVDQVLSEMKKWEPYNIVTLTGGEITLVAKPAAKIMDVLRSRNVNTVFSTNGYLTEEVDFLTKHADIVKIDIKGSRKTYNIVTGIDGYKKTMESIGICSSRLNTEVKILLHSFTTEDDILSILKDLKDITNYPDNLIIEFQLIKNFLHENIQEPDTNKMMNICKKAYPLPETVLLKHYGTEEVIYKLLNGEWVKYRKKEIPLKFNWNEHKNNK